MIAEEMVGEARSRDFAALSIGGVSRLEPCLPTTLRLFHGLQSADSQESHESALPLRYSDPWEFAKDPSLRSLCSLWLFRRKELREHKNKNHAEVKSEQNPPRHLHAVGAVAGTGEDERQAVGNRHLSHGHD